MNRIEKVDGYIGKAPNQQKEILTTLRDLISKSVPTSEEQFKWGQPVYTTDRDFCYITFTKNHVNLGFFDFEKIEDANNILEGTGKRMRHVKLSDISDIDPKELGKMIKQASKF